MSLNAEPMQTKSIRASEFDAIWTENLVRRFGDVPAVNGVNIQIPGAQWVPLGQALLAVGIVTLISMTLCFAALRSRVKRS